MIPLPPEDDDQTQSSGWDDIPVKQYAPGTFPKAPLDYALLKKRLWLRYWVCAAAYVLVMSLLAPQWLRYAAGGVAIGGFFLWSQMAATDRLAQPRTPGASLPQHGAMAAVQVVFSLIRLPFLAYLMVMLGDFTAKGIAVVLCGFLTYKVGIVLETVVQSWQGLAGGKPPKP